MISIVKADQRGTKMFSGNHQPTMIDKTIEEGIFYKYIKKLFYIIYFYDV